MILWLSENNLSADARALIAHLLQAAGCRDCRLMAVRLNQYVPQLRKGLYKQADRDAAGPQVREAIRILVQKTGASLVVSSDVAIAQALTGDPITELKALGSLYWVGKTPVLCTIVPQNRLYKTQSDTAALIGMCFNKIARWANGQQRRVPAFDYQLCDTPERVEQAVAVASASIMLGFDIETNGTSISCYGFAALGKDGKIKVFCIPLIDKRKQYNNYRFWPANLERFVALAIQDINKCPAVKCAQNGTYDVAYMIRDGYPVYNYMLDTSNMMHAMFCELPKDLWTITSVFDDYATYWKDDIKGEREAGFSIDDATYIKYWQYNGLDCYHTLLDCIAMLREMRSLPYAYANYNTTFRLAVGPFLEAGLGGLRVDQPLWERDVAKLKEDVHEAEANLHRLVGPDFNPRSRTHVGYFLYDFLGAKQTRLQTRYPKKYGKRGTDKAIIKLIREQGNGFVNNFLDRLARFQKAQVVLSYFGDWHKWTYSTSGRVLENIKACGTETGRASSSKSCFWCGGNGQNMTSKLKPWFAADPDYVLVDIDYKASDDRFVAYESRDPVKIELVNSTKDPHCFHVAEFFGYSYEEVAAAHAKDDPWTDDPVTGIRNTTKKIGHGKNYGAQPPTIFELMGQKAVVHAAKASGHTDAGRWSVNQCIEFVDQLCKKYDDPIIGLYKRLQPWRGELVKQIVHSHGYYTNVFGFTRRFFGDLKDSGTAREIAANVGQGDTAGNCNRALLGIYYDRNICDGELCFFRKQVHDSLVFLIHRSVIDEKIKAIRAKMEQPIAIHGHNIHIPVDIKIGLCWGKKMVEWREGITYEELQAHTLEAYGRMPFTPFGKVPELAKSRSNNRASLQPSAPPKVATAALPAPEIITDLGDVLDTLDFGDLGLDSKDDADADSILDDLMNGE